MNCNIETQVVFCCLCCRKIQRLCKARAEAKFTWIMPSRRQRCIYMNVCARREQKPSLLGLCRAAANFRASECRAELVRAMPSAAENVKKFSCKRVQSRTCSGYAERSRIFVQASAIELAHIAERSRKSQRKMSRNRACSYCRAHPKILN